MFAFYDDWLSVERSSFCRMDKYVTESLLSFPGGWVEVRQFGWSRPLESLFTTTKRCYLLELKISGRVSGGATRYPRAIRRRETETLRPMWLVPPDQTLLSSSMKGEARSIRCALSTELFDRVLEYSPRWSDNEDLVHAALNLNCGKVEWLLRRMYRELRHSDFATPLAVESLANQLTIEIVRALKLRCENVTSPMGGLAPRHLRLIYKRLQSEQALPSIEELATLCGMTARHLGRAFRQETGRTIGKDVDSAMAERARGMLGDGAAVCEVAEAMGYSTPAGFTTAFRRITGLLPSEINATGKARARGTTRQPPASTLDRERPRPIRPKDPKTVL